MRFVQYFQKLRHFIGMRGATVFALSYAFYRLRSPHDGQIRSIPFGPYTFYFSSLGQFLWLVIEIFFNEAYFLQKTDKPIRIIDCGANIGVSLLYFKTQAPNALVKCFEPNPRAREVLHKNVTANHWQDTVEIFPYALAGEEGSAEFFVEPHHTTGSSGTLGRHLTQPNHTLTTHKVTLMPLSKLLTLPIDFLKIDIEGSEFAVLKDLEQHGSFAYVPELRVECHHLPLDSKGTLAELLSLLERVGYQTFVRSNFKTDRVVGRSTAHSYLVFAWKSGAPRV
jgi:FkbM family methyltransferase